MIGGTFHQLILVPEAIGPHHMAHADASKKSVRKGQSL